MIDGKIESGPQQYIYAAGVEVLHTSEVNVVNDQEGYNNDLTSP
jgi:hypothetical protein